MVRKWSYLISTPALVTLNYYDNVTLKYVFKVFRKTTRFKKYILFPTVFFRKKDSIRKRRNNWINLTQILINWTVNYLKLKQLYKFFQNFLILPLSVLAPNLNMVLNRAKNNDFSSWNSWTLTKKFLFYLPLKFYYLLYLSRPSAILTKTLDDNLKADYFSTNLITCESTITLTTNIAKTQLTNILYLHLIQTQLNHILQIILSFYKLNILFTLNQILVK